MCNSKPKSPMAQIDGRPVLQPASNRISINPNCQTPPKKSLQKFDTHKEIKRAVSSPKVSPPVSPKPVTLKSDGLKNKAKFNLNGRIEPAVPGTSVTGYRQKGSFTHKERKIKVAHYGRVGSLKNEAKVVTLDFESSGCDSKEAKRCSFITPNSDMVFVAYHDEEWGVPVHDDRMLFELLVLSGAQVGSDWTTILKRRNELREAFAGFDAEIVAQYTARKIGCLSEKLGLDLTFVRGVVDNAIRILEVRLQLGSFDKYLWGFVNHKPLSPNYKCSRKIPVKTSKSELISKDMVRRGFRYAGPTVMYSFMQAAGLTNDHLVSCHRHRGCSAGSSSFAS
ncbi:DNA glycosylase superfamily protein [Rhynchospora pubera]|uniref:DNA glycosylase superfamily protein n=2 Tax=Rhynchospora pubera TaxID=906938 RepID=A0AAV8GUV6_9POAL|nr:DNA glycosylase superfamily protein [Rhynchospora pubera]